MELPCTEGPRDWDETERNIPEGIYTMNEYDDEDLEDGKPFAKIDPIIPPTTTRQVHR